MQEADFNPGLRGNRLDAYSRGLYQFFVKERIHLWLVVLAVFIHSALPLMADGKIYIAREKVPTSIPYQRAAILFDDNSETLILQSQYQVPGKNEQHALGWVVPLPAVPEIGSLDADKARSLFTLADFVSHPRVTRISNVLWFGILICALAGALIALTLSFFKRWEARKEGLRNFAFCSFFGAICWFLIALFFATGGIGVAGVESIKFEQVGIFDVEVVRADNASAMFDWLRRNEFSFDQEDEQAIQSYIDRKWCFLASKVTTAADLTSKESVSEGLLSPLVLRFPTPNPIYPTALTATGGHSTEILIYLLSKEPFKTSSDLECRSRTQVDGSWDIQDFFVINKSPENLPKNTNHLGKFKATLTPAQMAKDIEFLPDPGAQPYREHIYRW